MTSSKIKWLAIISMLLDHIGFIFFPEIILFRIIGRLAFPLFAFLIVEGFYHTKSIKAYSIRLLLFGIISEIPYDLVRSGQFFDLNSQNVYFTLFLGLIAIWFYDQYRYVALEKSYFFLIGAMIVSILIFSDYSFIGVLTIFIFYYYRNTTLKRFNHICLVMSILPLLEVINAYSQQVPVTFAMFIQLFSLFAFIPITLYNHKKGYAPKYVFYAFYPVHFIILYCIYHIINQRSQMLIGYCTHLFF